MKSSQIGKSTSEANQLSLKKAMQEAQRLNNRSPLPPVSPVELPESTASTILHVLRDIVETDDKALPESSTTPILTVVTDRDNTFVRVRAAKMEIF